jgi:very-short-patch-repair endonuclease
VPIHIFPFDDVPLPDPDAVPRVLTRAMARERGLTDRVIDGHVRAGRWRRVLARTYLTAPVQTERDRYDAALLFAGDDAALSGASALRESGVHVAEPGRVLVLVPRTNSIRSAGFVQIRTSVRQIEIEHWVGARRVVPARACADLCLTLRRIDDVRAIVARVVQHGHATVEEIAIELEAGPRNGSRLLREALREVGYGAESAPEASAATILRAAGLTGFVQNKRIELPEGGYYKADFLWEELRAILEVDSVEYHFDVADWESTMDRHLELATLGYSVVHRAPSALKNKAKFIAGIRAWLVSRRAELG